MNDEDLKARFESLRAVEAEASPSFARTLAAARSRNPRSALMTWPAAVTAAGLAALGFLLMLDRMERADTGNSLSKTLPVLLPPSSEPGDLFASPLFAKSDLPTDSLLPLSSRFPL